MKKLMSIALSLLLLCSLAAAQGAAPAMDDAAVVEEIVDAMSQLTAIPRPSHHEERISAFFMDWARAQGFEPQQDAVLNVMFDVPATEGMENAPLVILQGHMDMVVAYEKGADFDPLNDPITMVRNVEANTLTADGTSLGADDGAGCAMMMAVAKGLMPHGPVRILITADEESGMSGALGVSPEWLADAAYLINLDDEASNEVLVSTAAGDDVTVAMDPGFEAASGDLTLAIGLSGLKGGHSGVDIDLGRLNGIRALAGFLKELDEQGIAFGLAAFNGGTANNAIPSWADCRIVIASADEDAVVRSAEAYCAALLERYAGIEEGISLTVRRGEEVPAVTGADAARNIIRFMTEVVDGVYTMSADMEGMVESSSNLGVAVLDEQGFHAGIMLRSSVADLEEEIANAQLQLAQACGMTAEAVRTALPWAYDPDSKLLALCCEVYREQNGEEINVVAVHAGLECGTFKALNPALDMISIGPDLTDVHTTAETFHLNTLPKVWHLLEGILAGVQ